MSPRPPLFIPTVNLDKQSDIPLHRQLASQLRTAIQTNAITSGSRLPSSRTLAQILGLSRNTILAAYDELAAAGLIVAKYGSGMSVRASAPSGPSWLALRHTLRAAHYPARTQTLADPDGNPLYLVG